MVLFVFTVLNHIFVLTLKVKVKTKGLNSTVTPNFLFWVFEPEGWWFNHDYFSLISEVSLGQDTKPQIAPDGSASLYDWCVYVLYDRF